MYAIDSRLVSDMYIHIHVYPSLPSSLTPTFPLSFPPLPPSLHRLFLPSPLSSARTSSVPSSQCQVLQYFYRARTVAEVCTGLEGVSLEALVDILFSPLYPFKVTAFLLAKRYIHVALQTTVYGYVCAYYIQYSHT